MSKVFVNIGLSTPLPQFRIDRVLHSPAATHLRYVRDVD